MYTVVIQYVLPKPKPRSEMLALFKSVEERFRSMPGLIRKYFCYDESSHTGHSVYYWADQASADAFFNDDLVAEFQHNFGTTPEFFGIETLMLVDNEQQKTDYNE